AFLPRGHRLELHQRPGALEQANTLADKHWGDVQGDLVEKPRFETLPRDVRPEDDDVAAASRFARDRHRFLAPNVEKAAADPLYHWRLGGWIVPQDEERPRASPISASRWQARIGPTPKIVSSAWQRWSARAKRRNSPSTGPSCSSS